MRMKSTEYILFLVLVGRFICVLSSDDSVVGRLDNLQDSTSFLKARRLQELADRWGVTIQKIDLDEEGSTIEVDIQVSDYVQDQFVEVELLVSQIAEPVEQQANETTTAAPTPTTAPTATATTENNDIENNDSNNSTTNRRTTTVNMCEDDQAVVVVADSVQVDVRIEGDDTPIRLGAGKREIKVFVDFPTLLTAPVYFPNTTTTSVQNNSQQNDGTVQFCLRVNIHNGEVGSSTTPKIQSHVEEFIVYPVVDGVMVEHPPNATSEIVEPPAICVLEAVVCDPGNQAISGGGASREQLDTTATSIHVCVQPSSVADPRTMIESIESFTFIRGVEKRTPTTQTAIWEHQSQAGISDVACATNEKGIMICSFTADLKEEFFESDGHVVGYGEVHAVLPNSDTNCHSHVGVEFIVSADPPFAKGYQGLEICNIEAYECDKDHNPVGENAYTKSWVWSTMRVCVKSLPTSGAEDDVSPSFIISQFEWAMGANVTQTAVRDTGLKASDGLTTLHCDESMSSQLCYFSTVLHRDFFHRNGTVVGIGQVLGKDLQSNSSNEITCHGSISVETEVIEHRSCPIVAYECDESNEEIGSFARTIEYGSDTRICVSPTDEALNQGYVMAEIESVLFRQNAVIQNAVEDGNVTKDGMSSLQCQEGDSICAVTTELEEDFFTDNSFMGSLFATVIATVHIKDKGGTFHSQCKREIDASIRARVAKHIATGSHPCQVSVFVCDSENQETPATSGVEEGEFLRLCIRPSEDSLTDGLVLHSIDSLAFNRTGYTTQTYVKDGDMVDRKWGGNATIECKAGSDLCVVSSELFGRMFRVQGQLEATGNAVLQIGDFENWHGIMDAPLCLANFDVLVTVGSCIDCEVFSVLKLVVLVFAGIFLLLTVGYMGFRNSSDIEPNVPGMHESEPKPLRNAAYT